MKWRNVMVGLVLALSAGFAWALVEGHWEVQLQRSGRNHELILGQTQDETWRRCQDRIAEQSVGSSQWKCATPRYVAYVRQDPPPPPVDCVVSDPTVTVGAWSACESGQRSRVDTLTRTIITPPANGGDACPDLVTTVTVTEPCTVPPPSGALVFRDGFEYVVNETDSFETKTALFRAAGWDGLKDNMNRPLEPCRAKGLISTAASIPGYSGPMPGGRVLKLKGRPTTTTDINGVDCPGNQTDFYLSKGQPGAPGRTDPPGILPSNVYIQFWAFFSTDSHLAPRNKVVYPSDDGTAAGAGGDQSYMLSFRPSNQAGAVQPYGPNAYAVAHIEGASVVSNAPEGSHYIGHNLDPDGSEVQVGGTWNLVRWHIDHSGEHGVYETWVCRIGGQLVKTAEWRSGVTPGFTWITHANQRGPGTNMFKIPTTQGIAQDNVTTNFDQDLYIDDFVVATSESALPACH